MWLFKNNKSDLNKEIDNTDNGNMNTKEPLADENNNTVNDRSNDKTNSNRYVKESSNKNDFPSGNKSKDLMILISHAIEEWQKLYHLEKMPKKAVLRQVVALLKQVEEDWPNEL